MLLKLPLFFWILMISPMLIQGQNLILDPGFEEVEFVFDGKDTVYQYAHWQSLLKFKKSTARGLPSYTRYSKNVLNDKFRSYWIPYEGDSYFFSHYVYYRNLFQTKLEKPLEVGKKYKISFHYKILADGYDSQKIENSINKKIGVLLTESNINTEEFIEKFSDDNYHVSPHFAVNNFDGDSIKHWQKCEHIFEASKAYKYLTIGNFQKLIEIHELTNHPIRGVSFRIDLVTLDRLSDSTMTSDNINYAEIDSGLNLNLDTIILPDFEIRDSAILQYYALINAAEVSILDSNFVEAMDQYLNAFKIRYPYFRDFRNAGTVLKYANTKDSLLNKQFIELTKRDPENKSMLSVQIDSVFKLDQAARINKEGKKGAQDSSNYNFIFSFLHNNPISEQSIGISGMMNLEIILLHLSRYKYFSELIPLLADQVSKGNFNNRTFATLLDGYFEYHISRSKTGSKYLTQSIYPIFSKFLLPDWDAEYTLEINKKRATIGLDSLEDQYRKQFYNFKYRYREYEFYQFFTYFPAEEFCTEEEKISYLEKEKTMVKELMEKEKNLIIWTK